MPLLNTRDISVAFDMHGCPNACRHCWLGNATGPSMTEADVRWGAGQFRSYMRDGESAPFFQNLRVATWFREPDLSPDYRRLYALEEELSDDKPARYELLSVWRLARDPGYAKWAKEVGADTCQISFFGMEETTDWFHRRRGAFRANILATKRLLEAGIKPRWQVFLTRRALPELDAFMRFVDQSRVRRAVSALGGEFVLFLHTPAPDGEARNIEHLRPAIDEVRRIPSALVESSRRHLKTERLWRTEADWCAEILEREAGRPCAYAPPEERWFFVTSQWDVYANQGTLEPWWRLGNLRKDSAGGILDAYERDRPLGFNTIYTIPPRHLVEPFGDPTSRRIYDARSDVEALYVARYCERKAQTQA